MAIDKKEILDTSLTVATAAVGAVPGLSEAQGVLNLVITVEPLLVAGIVALLHKIHHSSNRKAAVKAANVAVEPYVEYTSPDDLYKG